MTKTATLLAATAATILAVSGLAATADAKGKRVVVKFGGGHHFHHKFHKRHFLVARSSYGYGYGHGDGCGYAKSMWSKTGNHYWKNRYYTCKGWW